MSYRNGERVISLASYDQQGTYLDASSLDGRRQLWADTVVRELVKHIQVKATGLFGTSPKDVTDERQLVLRDLVASYDIIRRPALLKAKMEALVDNTGTDTKSNFLKHRNPFSQLVSSPSDKPATAVVIENLLKTYPT